MRYVPPKRSLDGAPAPGGDSGEAGGGGHEGVQGEVVEEVDFEADGDDLAKLAGDTEMFAAVAEFGKRFVRGSGEFDAGGEDGGIEVDDGAQLDLDAELGVAGRQRIAFEDPAAAVAEGAGEAGKDAVAVFVGKCLDCEGLGHRRFGVNGATLLLGSLSVAWRRGLIFAVGTGVM